MTTLEFNEGDYIRYTKENEQEVIDSLMGMGYEVYAHDRLDSSYDSFVFKEDEEFKAKGFGFTRSVKDSNHLLKVDRTKEFFSHLNTEKTSKTSTESLPPKFYIDCGDRIEVREWLDSMGFKWCGGKSLLLDGLCESVIYVDNELLKCCYIGVRHPERYVFIKPKLGVTSFEVECIQSDHDEGRSKEIKELKRLHNEIGERLDALLCR